MRSGTPMTETRHPPREGDLPRAEIVALAQRTVDRNPGAEVHFKFTCEACGERCPLLPIALDVCPTCHAGIKPTRSWTWIDGVAITHVTEHGTLEHRAVCVLQPGNVVRLRRAGLIWIGERYYKTADDFTVEAARMGVSRRIPAVPRDFELGVTWVLLAHRKAVANPLYEH